MSAKQFTCFFLVCIFIVSLFASAASSNRLSSLDIINQVNRRGPYYGLISVSSTEEDAFHATGAFQPDPRHRFVDLAGRRFWFGTVGPKKVILVRCGTGLTHLIFRPGHKIPEDPALRWTTYLLAGILQASLFLKFVQVNAAAVTQQMLDVFDVRGIIHFGIAGNLNNSMQIGDVVVPKKFANTGIWNWLNPNATLGSNFVANLDIGTYNIPPGNHGSNLLGRIKYRYEEFFSVSEKQNTVQNLLWMRVTKTWLRIADDIEDLELEQCVNSTLCLPEKPKLVVGVRGSTANIFVDNAAYRKFLFKTFEATSTDMESVAVVMTSLSNEFPVIVFRGLSNLAGAQSGENEYKTFGSLAADNVALTVVKFIKKLPPYESTVGLIRLPVNAA